MFVGCIGGASSTLTLAASTPAHFVQQAAAAASATSSSLSLAFPSNTTAGDLLLVAFDFADNVEPSSVTDSQGNTFAETGSQLSTPDKTLSRVYYAKNIKGGADKVTVTLSAKSSYIELYLDEYAGINTTTPIDAEVGASGKAGTVSSGNATTTIAGDIIYGFCVADDTCSLGSGFSARSTFESNLAEDKLTASTGSYAATGSANEGWTMQMVALKSASGATGSAPGVSLSSTSLSFGNSPVGISSAAQTVTLTNTGSQALSISGLTLGGTAPSDFAEVADTCGSSVAGGAKCTIEATFTPAAASSYTATLSIKDNATGSPQTISLSGTGVHYIMVSWAASKTAGVTGYDVYRGTTSGKESTTPLNSTLITGTSYADSSVTAGTTYYYEVSAVNSSNTKSSASAQVSAKVP